MPGTKEGGIKARDTNFAKYGPDFYAKNGAIGGKLGTTGGFGSPHPGKDGLTGKERARIAGAKGGRISKRKPAKSLYLYDIEKDQNPGTIQLRDKPPVLDRLRHRG